MGTKLTHVFTSGDNPIQAMTIREHFASMAIQGLLAGGAIEALSWETSLEIRAVKIANQLIEELNKG